MIHRLLWAPVELSIDAGSVLLTPLNTLLASSTDDTHESPFARLAPSNFVKPLIDGTEPLWKLTAFVKDFAPAFVKTGFCVFCENLLRAIPSITRRRGHSTARNAGSGTKGS